MTAQRDTAIEGALEELRERVFAAAPEQGIRMTPMQYAKQQRMQRARLLLLEDLRVSEVAREVGYQSPAQFTRDFKASCGTSPAAYARRIRDLAS